MLFFNLASKFRRLINPTFSSILSRKLTELGYVNKNHQHPSHNNYVLIKKIVNQTISWDPTNTTRNLIGTINKLKTSNYAKKLQVFIKSHRHYYITMLTISLFFRVERVPFSGRYHMVGKLPFMDFRFSQELDFLFAEDLKKENQVVFYAKHPETTKAALMVSKMVQTMHTTIGLKHSCTVRAGMHAPGLDCGRIWSIAPTPPSSSSRYLKGTKFFSSSRKFSTKYLEGREWKVVVIDDHNIEAEIVSPLGIICISNEILDTCKDGELAFIIGHELGHAIGRHCMDKILRIPMKLFTLFGLVLLHISVHGYFPSRKRREMLSDLVENYRNRRMEHEADYIGMMLMAAAGYDPRFAPKIFEDTGPLGEDNVDDILFSHPCSYKRARYLEHPERMNKAMELYELSIREKGCEPQIEEEFEYVDLIGLVW